MTSWTIDTRSTHSSHARQQKHKHKILQLGYCEYFAPNKTQGLTKIFFVLDGEAEVTYLYLSQPDHPSRQIIFFHLMIWKISIWQ